MSRTRNLIISLVLIICFSTNVFTQEKINVTPVKQKTTFHDYTVKDINGNDFNLNQLKGKKVLVVNTASKCGLTPQYEILQQLYEKLDRSKFEIIGFPANNFLRQEEKRSSNQN